MSFSQPLPYLRATSVALTLVSIPDLCLSPYEPCLTLDFNAALVFARGMAVLNALVFVKGTSFSGGFGVRQFAELHNGAGNSRDQPQLT